MIYAALLPNEAFEVKAKGYPKAILGYIIGVDGRLYSCSDRPKSGEIMVVSCKNAPSEFTFSDIEEEACRGSYNAVLLDIPEKLHASYREFSLRSVPCIMPHGFSRRGCGYIGSAISGGSFRDYIKCAIERFGVSTLILEKRNLLFPLPCRSGNGRDLSEKEFSVLFESNGNRSFYSKELMCGYFFLEKGTGKSIVLFDTKKGSAERIAAAEQCGIEKIIAPYSDFKGILF